jgi:hypothetical protein
MEVQTTINAILIPKLTILYPGGDQLSSVLLEKEKNTVISELIERLCNLRAIDTKHICAYNDAGKKLDTKLTVEKANIVFIELIDKKHNKANQFGTFRSHIQDSDTGKIRKGRPLEIVLRPGQGVNLPIRQQLFSDEWESLLNFKSKHDAICNSYSDEFLMCCLWARKFDESRTVKLIQDNFQWRKANGFEFIPTTKEVEDICKGMASLNCIIPGARDKNGGGIFYSGYKKDLPMGKEPLTAQSLKKWIVWWYFVGIFQDGVDSLRNGVTMIQDLTEFGWIHFDLDIQKQLNVMSLFPIRVRRIVMYNPPVIFTAVGKIVKTFFPAKLMNRMELTHKLKDISNYVSADQLWTKFGGEMNHDTHGWSEKLIEWGNKNDEHYRIPLNLNNNK